MGYWGGYLGLIDRMYALWKAQYFLFSGTRYCISEETPESMHIGVRHFWDKKRFFHKGVPESGELEMGMVGEMAV